MTKAERDELRIIARVSEAVQLPAQVLRDLLDAADERDALAERVAELEARP